MYLPDCSVAITTLGVMVTTVTVYKCVLKPDLTVAITILGFVITMANGINVYLSALTVVL